MASFFERIVERVPIRTGLRVAETVRLLDPIALTRNLWFHRELLLQLSTRAIVSRYRGAYLGVLWSFLTPVFLTIIFLAIKDVL